MNALTNNLVITVLTFTYVFSLVAFMNLWVTKFKLPQDISRKITHIGAGSIIIFLPLYDDSHWSKYLNVAIFVLWIILLVQKAFFASDDDEALKTMTRNGDRKELLKGPLYFVIVATICGTFFYKTFPGIVAMTTLAWGDGIAPIIGSSYGKTTYTILSKKSLEGSLSMLTLGFAASIFFVWLILPLQVNLNQIYQIFLLTFLATIAEAFSPKEFDNLLIPTVVISGFWLISFLT
ncbi:MAG: phosphatidate cytidylyltransferase [Cyanobacteria bacterium P01_A01_bin.84]